ncbi:hypothetical protein EDB87DRAFT_1752833 [Lactarius vividus]|nr:hypothetical protein EDB87DRAFT_1752833 [Lactarius vividus]
MPASNSTLGVMADLDSTIIFEGDVLALCIRHGQLVLGCYNLPMILVVKDSLLAEYAHALLEEGHQTLRRIPGGHHLETPEYALLPALLDLCECSAIRDIPSWFSEKAGINQNVQHCQGVALPRVAPDIEKHFADLNVKHAVHISSNWLAQEVSYMLETTRSWATLKVEYWRRSQQ